MQARLATVLSLAVLALAGLALAHGAQTEFGRDVRGPVANFGIEGEGDIPLPAHELG
jgi:hypothetical protein